MAYNTIDLSINKFPIEQIHPKNHSHQIKDFKQNVFIQHKNRKQLLHSKLYPDSFRFWSLCQTLLVAFHIAPSLYTESKIKPRLLIPVFMLFPPRRRIWTTHSLSRKQYKSLVNQSVYGSVYQIMPSHHRSTFRKYTHSTLHKIGINNSSHTHRAVRAAFKDQLQEIIQRRNERHTKRWRLGWAPFSISLRDLKGGGDECLRQKQIDKYMVA